MSTKKDLVCYAKMFSTLWNATQMMNFTLLEQTSSICRSRRGLFRVMKLWFQPKKKTLYAVEIYDKDGPLHIWLCTILIYRNEETFFLLCFDPTYHKGDTHWNCCSSESSLRLDQVGIYVWHCKATFR